MPLVAAPAPFVADAAMSAKRRGKMRARDAANPAGGPAGSVLNLNLVGDGIWQA
jgi:hypothetical protein